MNRNRDAKVWSRDSLISPLKTLKSLVFSAIELLDEQFLETLKDVKDDRFTYMFVSPVKMLSINRWRRLLTSDKYRRFLVTIAIDEAHCISQWGLPNPQTPTAVPFRTWYGSLRELK